MMIVTRRLEGLVIPTERNLLSASFSRVYYTYLLLSVFLLRWRSRSQCSQWLVRSWKCLKLLFLGLSLLPVKLRRDFWILLVLAEQPNTLLSWCLS